MKNPATATGNAAGGLRRVSMLVLFAMLPLVPIATARANAPLPSSAQGANVTSWAMHWFKEMQAGRTDRSQYAPAYRTQITKDAVKAMSRALDRYGAAPLRDEIVQTRKIDSQTFYVVKFIFPRGDATSLLFGFDAAGKITGIGIGGLAGD